MLASITLQKERWYRHIKCPPRACLAKPLAMLSAVVAHPGKLRTAGALHVGRERRRRAGKALVLVHRHAIWVARDDVVALGHD